MAMSPPRPCAEPGCRELVRGSSRCPAHQKRKDGADALRKKMAARSRTWDSPLNTPEWRELSARVRAEEPTCRRCGRRPSAVAHHIQSRRDHPELAMERGNLMGVCRACHAAEEWGAR